jgi:hypothetical protein
LVSAAGLSFVFVLILFQSIEDVCAEQKKSGKIKVISRYRKLKVISKGKVRKYYRLNPGEFLTVRAKGKAYMLLKTRVVLRSDEMENVPVVLKSIRDEKWVSENELKLKRDRKAHIAAKERMTVTVEKLLLFEVPEGKHSYKILNPEESKRSILVSVYRTRRRVERWLASDESLIKKEPEKKLVEEKRPEKKLKEVEPTVPPVAISKIEVKKPTPPPPAKYPFMSAAVRIGLLVPSAEVDSTFNFNYELRYIPNLLNRELSFGLESGFYMLWGEGKNIHPQIGVYEFEWMLYVIPLRIGVYYQLPLQRWLKMNIPFIPYVTGGFTMLFLITSGRVINGDISRSSQAFGGHIGAGAEFIIWKIGRLQAELRYSTVHSRMGLPYFNETTGDIGGFDIFVGYRFLF